MRVLITGANGHLGMKLIAHLRDSKPDVAVVAAVRSTRAAQQVEATHPGVDIKIIDYRNASELAIAGQGCDALVHLVGIIKETRANTFEMAHEDPCRAITQAGLSVKHIVSLGIVGTSLSSDNACLRSRAQAEELLQRSSIATTILRVPMVLGPDDYASMALGRNARSRFALSFRSASLEQPIYSSDVVSAIVAALELPPENRTLSLGGPESLSRAMLIKRAGKLFGKTPLVISLPVSAGYALAWVFEKLSPNPPLTRAMLGVLDHDDANDNAQALQVLGIELTSLDDMLGAVLR